MLTIPSCGRNDGIRPSKTARSTIPTSAQPTLSNAGMSAQRLFWAWYTAGVDTMRCAYSVQSTLVRHLIDVSPALLASQFLLAFHATSDTTYAEHGRALA